MEMQQLNLPIPVLIQGICVAEIYQLWKPLLKILEPTKRAAKVWREKTTTVQKDNEK
jgi:hypothetical protein